MLMVKDATRPLGTITAALVLLLTSCAPPDAIRQFVTTARDTTAQFAPFVQDIADSCERRKLAERPATEIATSDDALKAACKEDSDLAPGLLGAMKVLTNYFNALDSLASNEAVTYDKEIDGIANKLQTAAKFPAPATDAVKGLAKFLADAVASGYQKKKVADAVTSADKDVATLTDAIGRIIGVEYVRDLDSELDTLKNRYTDAMRTTKGDDAVALLLQRHWRADLAGLQKKRVAAVDFQKALEKIRAGHHELTSRAGQWSAGDLIKEMGSYTASIKSLVKSFQAATF
jgi:hypothetical protein